MRWLWLDRYTEFVSGSRAAAIKNVSAAEEQVFDYYPGYGAMPGSLIVEGIGQAGGLLFAEGFQFQASAPFIGLAHPKIRPKIPGREPQLFHEKMVFRTHAPVFRPPGDHPGHQPFAGFARLESDPLRSPGQPGAAPASEQPLGVDGQLDTPASRFIRHSLHLHGELDKTPLFRQGLAL